MTQAPSTREVVVPAEYRTITQTVHVQATKEHRVAIAAEYTTVSRQVKVSDRQVRWQIIGCRYGDSPCDQPATLALQRSLSAKGYNPGAIDGIYGPQTRDALGRFQTANGVPHEAARGRTRPHEDVGTRTQAALGVSVGN